MTQPRRTVAFEVDGKPIAALAADPQLRAEMGRAGRSHVERCYDRAALAREYRKIL